MSKGFDRLTEKIKEGIAKALEDKGKRNFLQTVELIVNLKGIDFSKPENKINIEAVLKEKGNKNEVVLIAEKEKVYEIKEKYKDVKVFTLEEIEKFDKKEMKKLLKKNTIVYCSPKVIGNVAKLYGKVFASRGKNLKPLLEEKQLNMAKDTVLIRTRGKTSSNLQVPIGKENFNIDMLTENALIVLDSIKKVVNESNIKSIYVKLTMGKPVKIA